MDPGLITHGPIADIEGPLSRLTSIIQCELVHIVIIVLTGEVGGAVGGYELCTSNVFPSVQGGGRRPCHVLVMARGMGIKSGKSCLDPFALIFTIFNTKFKTKHMHSHLIDNPSFYWDTQN